MRASEAVLIGLATAFIVSGISAFLEVRVLLFQLYAYVLLALIIYFRSSGMKISDFRGLSDRLLFVVDKEEKRVKKILSGEEFHLDESGELR